MKARTRFLSLLLALLLVLTVLPWDTLSWTVTAEPAAEINGDPVGIDTDMTIDFDFETNNHVTDAASTLRLKADATLEDHLVAQSAYQTNYSQYMWKHVTVSWKVKDKTPGSLRYYLTSTADEDTYVVLDKDDDCAYYKSSLWEPMVIRSDKVLDLNGHKLNIRYDSNRGNDSPNQTTHEEYHNCVCIEIEDGATLTIIDSSAWRGANGGKGTGRISFTGYMVDPYNYDIKYYTTRDLFHVNNGNLIIYGGEFQAGRKKDQLKKNFSWRKLRTVIGNAVELGVNVAEYATGISVASAAYASAQSNSQLKQETNMSAYNESGNTGNDDGTDGATQTMVDRNGTNLNPKTKDTRLDTANEDAGNPGSGREQTVDERKKETDANIANGSRPGTQDGENKATADGKAKDDSNTKVAKAQKDVVDKIVNKSALGNITDGAFDLVEGIIGMIGKDENSRVTQSIKGTVVRVGGNGSFVAYGGTFKGYGSTPNTRNAVVEVVLQTGGKKNFDNRKYQGGLVYVYGGTFEGYNGANIFNMINITEADQYAVQSSRSGYNVVISEDQTVKLDPSETAGVEVLYYEHQDQINQPGFEHKMINTSNVQVRGGTFRCFYDMMNVAIKQTGDSEHFSKFPGTSGCVNLGVESYGENLIQDGRIQIVDRYGAGALVLLDDRTEEKEAAQAAGLTYTEGLYHYRLFCGDTELRCKYYLEVSPNTAKTNAAYSMQLATYYGTGKRAASLWVNDEDNVRAASRQTENYFDFEYDDPQNAASWSVMPNFYHPGDNTNQGVAAMDPYGEFLNNSEVWYYPVPLDADGDPIQDVDYGEPYFMGPSKSTGKTIRISKWTYSDHDWNWYLNNDVDASQVQYYMKVNDSVRTTMKYFTYKLYRVDPLTRENINESGVWGEDEPLLTVRYGSVDEQYLKCKLPLKQAEAKIQEKDPGFHYESGALYRIVLEVEEYVCMGYQGSGSFGQKMPVAKSESSILFRCLSVTEKQSNGEAYLAHDYTPVQWLNEPRAGQTASVRLVNGKAGMTDYWGDSKVFDVYYQWYEVNADGSNPRLIAGTDNVYDRPTDDMKPDHRPLGWDILHDGKQYVNTVDPNDPKASTYQYHGLPGTATTPNPALWTPEMIHLYSRETTDPERYKKDQSMNLCLGNNDVFETGVDNCYIPAELAGKYIQVKVIVLNYKWPAVYDKKQTFESHVYHIPKVREPLRAELQLTYQSGYKYAAYNHPMTFKLSMLEGLDDDEYVTEVWYTTGGGCKSFTGLNVTSASAIPAATYPDDFYPAGYDLSNLSACQNTGHVYIETNKRAFYSPYIPFNYEVEATGYRRCISECHLNRSEVENGQKDNYYQPFKQVPNNASIGYDYVKDSTTTNKDVAYLNAQGYLMFGGKCGTATISIKGKDNVTKKATVTVIQDFDYLEFSDIQAPARGQPLDFSVSIPDDAPYEIENVQWWTDTGFFPIESGDNYLAENFKTYSIEVTVKTKPGTVFNFDQGSYSLTTEDQEGVTNTVVLSCSNNPDAKQISDDEFLFTYDFPMIGADIPNACIHEVHITFPTEVPEGTSWEDWRDNQIQIVTDGYDDHYTALIYPTYADSTMGVLNAHGEYFYQVLKDYTRLHPCFLKGVQTGISLQLAIDTSEYEDSFMDHVPVYVNGERVTAGVVTFDHNLYIPIPDSLTVTDGKTVEPMPKVYQQKPVCWVTGTTSNLYVNDVTAFYACDDPRVSFTYSAPYPYQSFSMDQATVDAYLTFDPDALTLTVQPVIAGSSSGAAQFSAAITVTANFDQDGDGKPELQESYILPINHDDCVYYQSSAPAAEGRYYTFRYYDLNWEPAGTIGVTCSDIGILSIPELEDHFVWMIRNVDDEDQTANLTSYGLGRIGMPPSGTYEVLTVSAWDNVEVWPGVTDVYVVTYDDDNGDPLPHIQISVDGVHFQERDYLDGLEPDTNYTLYYRQGIDGKVYSKLFRTGSVDYGVRVGRTPVTDANTGNLDVYNWEYDPDTQNLTIRNLDLTQTGVYCGKAYRDYIQIDHKVVIYADHDLTLTVLGWNWIERVPTDLEWIENNCIYVKGDLTLQGSGDLYLTGGSYQDSLIYSETGDITMAMGGKLTAEQGTLFGVPNGTVYYQNGEIDFTSYIRVMGVTPHQYTGIVVWAENDRVDFSGRVHGLTMTLYDIDGNSYSATPSNFMTLVSDQNNERRSFHITPNHAFNQQVPTYEYLQHGQCVSDPGCSFYYACACGAKGTTTYTKTMSGHTMTVSHAGREPTCTLPGWDAYTSCAVCNYYWRNYYPAAGHSWQTVSETQPTCTADGCPAYQVCTRCGLGSQAHIPTDEEIARGNVDTALLVWKATGHSYRRVEGTPVTCTADGQLEHYVCDRCGQRFAHQGDTVAIAQSDLPIPSPGHAWGPWTTEGGVKTRACARCGQTQSQSSNPFVDVKAGKWYYDAIMWAFYHDPQITSGTDATHFSPNATCTRAQVMTFLWHALNDPAPNSMTNPFTDVKPGKYYEKPVLWAYYSEPQVTGGTSATTFGINDPCKREQVVTFLWKAAGAPEPVTTVNPFKDVKEGKWYYKAVLWAVENGITSGMSADTFGVGKTCTRAQIVTFLYAAYGPSAP